MSVFVSASRAILNIGENPTRILSGLVDQFDDKILDEVRAYIDNGRISQRLKDINIDELNEIKNFFDQFKNNEYVRMLLKTVDDIPQNGLNWSWGEVSSPTLPVSGSFTLTLGASAAAGATILPRPSYSFSGKAGIAGSVHVPFSFGAFGVSGSAKENTDLQVSFTHPPSTRLLTALANDLPVVAGLADPKQLLNQAFVSASLKLQGEVNLGAKLTAGKSWLASLGGAGRSTATAEVTAGVQYGIDWARTGEFDIAIQRNGQLLSLSLTEVDTESKRRSLSIGANVQFSGVQAALKPVLDQLAGLPAPLAAIVQKYARPADLFKELLTEKLSTQDAHVQQLAKVITGEGSASSFVEQLAEEARRTVDDRAERWTAFSQGEVTQLTAAILGRLNIPQPAKADTQAVLNTKLLEASQSLLERLQADIESALKTATGSAASEVINFLKSIAGQTATALTAANTTAGELLEPVKALLAKYRSFEQSLTDAVEVIDKEELALQFMRSVDRSKDSASLLAFTLDPSQARAQALYRQMLVGDFRDAMIDGLDKNKAYITLVSGQFKDIFERKATAGLTLNFFGVPLSYQSILTSQLAVQNAVGGDISIFDATGSAAAQSVAFGEKQEVRISSSLSLVGEKDHAQAQGLAVRLCYSDKNLTSRELRNFITSFANVGLVSQGAADRISDGTTTIAIPEDDGNRALTVHTQLSFTRGEVETMAALDEDSILTTAIREQLDALDDTPVNRDYLVGILPQNAQLDPNDHDLFIGSSLSNVIDELMRRRPAGRQIFRRSQLNFSAILIQKIGTNAQDLVEFLKLWRELVALPLPQPGPDGRLKASDVSTFDQKNTEMIACLKEWAQVPGFLQTALEEEFVSPWALAFLKTVRALSGRDKDPLPLYVSWSQDDRVRRIAVM